MPHFVIMGAGRVGVMLARTLEASGHTVAVIDQDERAFQPLRKGFEGRLLFPLSSKSHLIALDAILITGLNVSS